MERFLFLRVSIALIVTHSTPLSLSGRRVRGRCESGRLRGAPYSLSPFFPVSLILLASLRLNWRPLPRGEVESCFKVLSNLSACNLLWKCIQRIFNEFMGLLAVRVGFGFQPVALLQPFFCVILLMSVKTGLLLSQPSALPI